MRLSGSLVPTTTIALAVALAVAPPAAADPITLRVATIAPAGTAWAREFGAFARDVEAGTHGAVHIKIYYSGIAGDDVTVLDRIRRDQLDGAMSSESCMRLSPSLRVTRVFGLFQNRDEAAYILTRLRPTLDAEFLKEGFIHLGEAALGPEVLFTREPVRDMAELRKTALWIWELDDALRAQAPALGLHVTATSLELATRAYDEKRVDGFIAVPSAALAFQWSAQARYLEDVRLSYRNGCLFVASRAFDALPIDAQSYVRAATAKLRNRLDDLGKRQDDALLEGLFARQGLRAVPVSERFRLELFSLARDMRTRVGGTLVSQKLLAQVLNWLADYRVEHQFSR
ncbi:MAG: TRAP-type C4-dicarboxylate transport system, substrate-binding protein [Myxococcales bacterium]|nr:TRAP-type C4-dicarboxylate transport system, substrate-binding protein [Myxococcales bacterium]